ncbi:hypothetical protein CRG98_013682 [Punica granatum]|uniref:Uncharacterized protein n=1 Tax=Punica granatum TaxID=22663 RepID=A0A2I0KCV0_PUNGR|nr:hypothetical protein CRG98_013682 [Punica granatum]
MWDDRVFFPYVGIEILLSKSLIKITGLSSIELLISFPFLEQGMTKVEAISLEGYQFRSENLCFKDDQFKNPPILRILLLDKASLSGNFEGILPNLRGLSWHLCNISPMLPTNLNLKNLIVLDLSRSMVIEDWAGWRLMKVAAKLKVLDLTECAHLTGTPGFSAFPALEETDSSILSQLGLG